MRNDEEMRGGDRQAQKMSVSDLQRRESSNLDAKRKRGKTSKVIDNKT